MMFELRKAFRMSVVVTIPTTLPFSSTGNPLNLCESISSTASFTVISGVTTIGSGVIAAFTLMNLDSQPAEGCRDLL